MAEASSVAGGYDLGEASVFTGKTSLLKSPAELELLKCSKCNLLLRDPKQVITCGHRYCAVCIERLTRSSGPFTCVIDDTEYTKKEVWNDRGCLKEIEGLEVNCPMEPNLCTWRGKLSDMEDHAKVCSEKLFSCDFKCGQSFKKDKMETHLKSECPHRPKVCKYCKEKFPLSKLKDHFETCDFHPMECNFCHKTGIPRHQLVTHYDDCTEYEMSCPCNGCQFKGNKDALNEHILKSHIVQVVRESASTHRNLEKMQNENKALQDQVSDLKSQICELQRTNETKEERITKLSGLVKDLESEKSERNQAVVSQQRRHGDFVEADSTVVQTTQPPSSNEPPPTTKATPPAAPLSDTKSRGGFKVKHSGRFSESAYRSQLQHMHESLLTIQNSLAQYATAIEEVRLRQDVLDVKTTTGEFIWKIPDIRRRYRDAVEQKTVSLYSPPFFTSPHGYRVCIRTYLNGDGLGKGTHISVFFFIMRSEHDNLLSWPFKQSVRFTLINQKDRTRDITEAFIPDPKSPSFQKPEFEMNIASGFPKFIRQSVLQDESFCQDDVIYIKCHIDLAGLSGP